MTQLIKPTLDEWYKTINKIYLDRNYYRHPESVFAHLVEIVGGLSLLASKKPKQGVIPTEHIAKAIAWWMALCGKMRIRSIENLLWSKYPYVCPYCLEKQHVDSKCRIYKKEHGHPNWTSLREYTIVNEPLRPKTLSQWLEMFNKIYPVNSQSEDYSTIFARFTEELGELSEATRLFQLQPGYFFSEASDFFAWLMHLHTLYIEKEGLGETQELLEKAMYSQYPNKCKDCDSEVCNCPPILRKTLGRIAHDLPLHSIAGDQRPLLELHEAMASFGHSSKSISIGKSTFIVNKELILDLRAIAEKINQRQVALSTGENSNQLLLYKIFEELKKLAETERINQDSINKLVDMISALPSESKSTVNSILSGITSSSFSTALIESIKLLT